MTSDQEKIFVAIAQYSHVWAIDDRHIICPEVNKLEYIIKWFGNEYCGNCGMLVREVE